MDTPCSAGRYCPAGTTSENEFLCPSGTYYGTTGAQQLNDCIPCTAGSYCETTGLSAPTGQCDAGI